MTPIETFAVGNKVVEIHADEDPMDPRGDDNMGVMVCFHSRYRLPHEAEYRSEDYKGWAEMEAAITEAEDVAVILPVYMYDHSGLAFRTTRFDCGWDSGQVGFIYVSKAKVKDEYGAITKDTVARATKILVGEVETYHQYSSGDVYGYIVKRFSDTSMEDEVLDSCWGFYGIEYAKEAGAEAAS